MLQARIDDAKGAHPDAYERIMESWAIESTYNSNNIEGSTLSLGDTALVYDGVSVNAPARDIRQAEGGFAALHFLRDALDSGERFSEALVKRAHELVFAEAKDPATRGAYRTVEVEITGTSFDPAPAVYVAERMGDLVATCLRSKRHAVVTAALFHLEFESVHPFVDGNGRTGRLLSNFLLMAAGYEPVNIQAESRARYITTLRTFQEQDDPYPFALFFCANLLECQVHILDLLDGRADGEGAGSGREELAAYLEADPIGDPINDPINEGAAPLTARQQAIIDALLLDGGATYEQLAQQVNASPASVKRDIAHLKAQGLVVRVGSNKTGHWKVIGRS